MIRILHLSDLHFGQHSRLKGKDPAGAGKSFHRALVEAEPAIRQGGGDGIDLVVVTGDLAEVGKPREFAQAHEFLRALAGELGIEHRRFVFCPGNHDISRPLCLKVAADQAIEDFDDDELRRRIDRVKLRFYDAFLAGFYDTDPDSPLDGIAQPLEKGAFVHGFPGLRLSVAALNSCEKESHRDGDHLGLVSEAQAQALMTHWRRGEAASWLKIVAVHHNPTPTVEANVVGWRQWLEGRELTADQIAAWEGDVRGFEGGERLKRIVADCQVQLVLHGHHHAKDRHVWPWRGPGVGHVLSAGSMALVDEKLPGSEPASFQLLTLDPEAAKLEAKSLVWIDWARTVGEVEEGTFTADPAGVYEQRLDLPDGFGVADEDPGVDAGERGGLAGFVRTFRSAFRGMYSRWDLATAGVTQAGGAGRPIDVGLDAMYVGLRLGQGSIHSDFEFGAPIEPEELLLRQRPLAIRGAAGSGKTTWMRWTFRRLLDSEQALPLMLVLRDLARAWATAKPGAERSLEAFLDAWAAEQIGSGWQTGRVKQLLETDDGPTPVLLVDGWDELGELGERVRAKLVGMIELYPRMQVVVSSRPYGEGRPSHAEDFEVLDLQPLSGKPGERLESWGEIGQMAGAFFEHCYRDETEEQAFSTEGFLEALARSSDAQALARTPLLLTMMLLISRSRPLPDKRHDLYEACIDNLLTARAERKEREGAQLLHQQWRPDDGDERKRAVAGLAYGLQTAGAEERSQSRQLHAVSWDEALLLLPEDWNEGDRKGFLAWLAGPAGLLVDRSDETLTFVHLSFQEYLGAWHLDATVEGTRGRLEVFRRHLGTSAWRETLLLWAARIDKQNPRRLDEVVAGLDDQPTGLLLAGLVFADGLGSEGGFETWAEHYLTRLGTRDLDGWDGVAKAWQGCQQEGRRVRMGEMLEHFASEAYWPGWLRLWFFAEFSSSPRQVPRPVTPLTRALVEAVDGSPTPARMAAGRLFCGGPSFWPLDDRVGLLQLWPGERRPLGLRLQGVIACGGDPIEHSSILRDVLTVEPRDQEPTVWTRGLARYSARYLPLFFSIDLAGDLAGDLARDFVGDLARDFASDFARDFARGLARKFDSDLARYFAHYLASDFARDFARYLASDFPGDFANYLVRNSARYFTRDLARDSARDFARDLARDFSNRWNLELEAASWLHDFVALELTSPGRAVGHALMTHHRPESPDPQFALLAAACRLTNAGHDADTSELDQALEAVGTDLHPVWPALARHLARHSDSRDRELLESLTRDPDQVDDGPLRWGLRFIVRGDVMLDDGTFVTLDELCDRVDLPHLPYLEDPPPPLEVDWDYEDED